MNRFSFIWYIVLIIVFPISIILISGNLILRVPETYVYHFNDSQVVDDVVSYVSGGEFADAIADYFNSIGGEFQVYEENGDFRDPIFDEDEAYVMKKAKGYMTWTIILGILLLGASITIYIYLSKVVRRKALRTVGFIAVGVSAASVVVLDIALAGQSFRARLYDRFIGIELNKSSSLRILLSSPFERTYIIFSSVLAIAIICLVLYIHSSLTKEKRLFS